MVLKRQRKSSQILSLLQLKKQKSSLRMVLLLSLLVYCFLYSSRLSVLMLCFITLRVSLKRLEVEVMA